MTTNPGRVLAALLLILLTLPALAAVEATIDRPEMALGETLRLTLRTTAGESLDDIDLSALEQDFEILQRSTTSSTRIINGNRSSSRELNLDLTPRRTGTAHIPAFTIDGATTKPRRVTVREPVQSPDEDAQVLFDAELSEDSVYVQQQLVLTLRLQQAVPLESRTVSELEIDNAFIKELEQRSYQRVRGGRTWQVIELRYAIFPEQSGMLEIPSQIFSASERNQRRSIFDISRPGALVRRSTQALSVEVKPRPAAFPSGAAWLPAKNLSIEEQWSTDPEKLQAGDSVTRSLRLVAEGLQGAQLPPVLFEPMEGLRFYPEQPDIEDRESDTGLTGVRLESAAYVPTRAGDWTLPQIRIPWWDTEEDRLRYATVPTRTLQASAVAQSAQTQAAVADAAGEIAAGSTPPAGVASRTVYLWQAISACLLLLWLATLFVLWRRPRRIALSDTSDRETVDNAASVRESWRRLTRAVATGNAAGTRGALLRWAQLQWPDHRVRTLEDVGRLSRDDELKRHLEALDRYLFGGGDKWDSAALEQRLNALRKQAGSGASDNASSPLQRLYAQE